ncbi:MAG: hypothetical protein ACFBWO_12215 [Paracoccaceae bacterium]
MHDDYRLPFIDAGDAARGHRDGTLRLVDVRKPAARAEDPRAVEGTERIDPFALDHGHPILSHDGPVAFFCVHGHHVSRFACALGRLHGRETYYVAGGFLGLVEAGAPLAGSTR